MCKRWPPSRKLGAPDYFGTTPNYANSPLPTLDTSGNVVPGTGIRKFVDSLPGLGAAGANDLGQYIPVAVPDQTTYPGADYYVIGLIQYTEKMHSDLPPTKLRGYVQLNASGNATVTPPSYLGPTIIAQKDRPVRVKFINKLPTGTGGNLFLPVDTTVMGAGMGPQGGSYSENRATLHLHGGLTPWISDGTPHQWTTPAGQVTTYTEGVSVHNVPDMDGGNEPTGTLTFYYTNQQSARLMFYHDHTYGLTRLNVYAGEAAPYVLQDPVEQTLVNGGTIPGQRHHGPVTVPAGPSRPSRSRSSSRTRRFVPTDTQLAAEDPTWDKAKWGGLGNLWLPARVHAEPEPMGPRRRQRHGPLGLQPLVLPAHGSAPAVNGPVPNPLYPQVASASRPQNPGTPNPTIVPEAFMDTPLVNGTAYPFLKVATQGVPVPHPERLQRPHAEPADLLRQVEHRVRRRQRQPAADRLRRGTDDRGRSASRRSHVAFDVADGRSRRWRTGPEPCCQRRAGVHPDRQRRRLPAVGDRSPEHSGRVRVLPQDDHRPQRDQQDPVPRTRRARRRHRRLLAGPGRLQAHHVQRRAGAGAGVRQPPRLLHR